ncbi:MAG: hypothetical protein U9R43_13395 [Thermodesulfobacteriota bacterium]|nr:hypothetical protein [Thermodesulfobacteriota bacterium]
MKTAAASTGPLLKVITTCREDKDKPPDIERLKGLLGVAAGCPEKVASSLPFFTDDITAGTENELMAVVTGNNQQVDLPLTIRESRFYNNYKKSVNTGDAPRRGIADIDEFIEENTSLTWENSWVRFSAHRLGKYARLVFERDLMADKRFPVSPLRKDAHKFKMTQNGEELIRIPVSYLLKLALAEITDYPGLNKVSRDTGRQLMVHFLSDNTSPETFSFFPVPFAGSYKNGMGIAKETSSRFLLCQLLVMYANQRFGLLSRGQKATICFAPHPPLRQRKLNGIISDEFYRELFMSPCLSGWDCGEEKHRYMALCHRVLSRSHLNAIIKLKNAGIITNNLVVLPNMSNISLANNGTHITLGSRKLTEFLKHENSEFGTSIEKYMGDLVIKITEHFLPLFVGTYSAAPYRLDFSDFHPEQVLGFLPHELTTTHLKMIWRRWKKKAKNSVFRHPLTPFGPEWLDSIISKMLCLRGDFIQDFRLIDYLVCLMSSSESPAFNGEPGNDMRLKEDLYSMGVFHPKMPLYLLYRQREYSVMGFSGFEGRHYSLFESIPKDMAPAADLQGLITALAYHYILSGEVSHEDIPDSPFIESERRQIFFGAAIGIPTFFVRKDTANRFLMKIIKKTKKTRMSHRYAGYIRVYNSEYKKVLFSILNEDGKALIETMGLASTIEDLEKRLDDPGIHSVSSKLTRGILESAGEKSPMKMQADEFLASAENYYLYDLRKKQLQEALDMFRDDIIRLDSWETWRQGYYNKPLLDILGGRNASDFMSNVREEILNERASENVLEKLIHLMLLCIHKDMQDAKKIQENQ